MRPGSSPRRTSARGALPTLVLVTPIAPTARSAAHAPGAASAPTPGPPDHRGGHPRLRALATVVVCSLVGPAVFLVLVGVSLEEGEPRSPGAWVVLLGLDAGVGLAACALAGVARGSRAMALGLVAASTVSAWALPAGAVGAVRAGAHRSRAVDAAVVALVVVGGTGYGRLQALVAPPSPDPLPLWADLAGLSLVAVLLLLVGRARGTRSALVASLRAQAEGAERERAALAAGRAAEVARTRAEERSAIARDMHDTLSHQLSIVALHAGALASRDDLPPERARDAARTVRDAAADANAVLREVLVALRSTDPGQRLGHHGGAEPLPTSASVEEQAARARALGQRVEVAWRGLAAVDLDERSPATAVSLAQVLAELLVNARKHAPGEPVDVVLAHEGADLVLRSSNSLPSSSAPALGTGLGLVGVAERARLLGGSARSGTTPDDRFVVEVVVPWSA